MFIFGLIKTTLKLLLKYTLVLLAFLYSQFLSYGQEAIVDSLLKVIARAEHDTTKINAYNSLFLEFEFADDKKAGEYLDKAYELAQKINYKKGLATTYIHKGYFAEDKGDYAEAIKNYNAALKTTKLIPAGDKAGEADAYNNLGNVYFAQSDYVESIKNYSASLKLYQEVADQKGISSSFYNIANVYYSQGNYPEALKMHLSALKIREKTKDQAGLASSYSGLGRVYYSQNNYVDALKNYFAALEIEQAIGHKKGIAAAFNNIGIVYSRQSNFDEALKNYFSALKFYEEIGYKTGIAFSYNNIGNVYDSEADLEKDHTQKVKILNKALENYFLSLKIKEELGNNSGIASSYNNIGNIYFKLKNYREADVYLIKARNLSQKIGYKDCLKDTYLGLTSLDSAMGNYKGAYDNHKLYILYRDSLDNEETRKKTIQSQMAYDFEKKEAVAQAEHKKELENQEELSEEKSRKQKIIIVFVVSGLFLVLVFAAFIFRSLRTTRKQKDIIEIQKWQVESQKQEVEQQKQIVEEHQKEIIDSITYARRIQRSLLPTEKYIEKNMNRLRKI